MNIAYLLIEGDYEEKGKHEQLLYNESNNIIFFKENIILFKDKVNSRYFDIKNFLANDNYEFRNADVERKESKYSFKNLNFISSKSRQKIKNFENFLSVFNREMRKILKNHFNFEEPKIEENKRFKKRFTTVLNPEIGKLFTKITEEKKIFSTKKLFEVNRYDCLTTKSEAENSHIETNYFNRNNNFPDNFIPRTKPNISKKKTNILHFDKSIKSTDKNINNLNINTQNNKNDNVNEKEKLIDISKLVEIQKYIELEKKKIELLFMFYETTININVKTDYSNILNGFDFINKTKKNFTHNSTLITEFSGEYNNTLQNRSPIISKKIIGTPKYSEQQFTFFDNIKLYKEINPYTINQLDQCELPGVISCLGFDHTMFLSDDIREQLAILDTFLLNILGVLKFNISNKILQILIIKNISNKNQKANLNLIKKTIKKALCLNKSLGLGLVYNLIEKLIVGPNKNLIATAECLSNFKNELEIRKLNCLSLNVNILKTLTTDFQINFKPDSNFDKRKVSLFHYIKRIDKELNIFKDLLIINQHFYDSVIFMKIQDQIIEEDQFAYRVFLEFRNFLFEYQDKNTTSPQNKIFRSLADKQLLEYSCRNLANKFYFWKPNISVNLQNNDDTIVNTKLNNLLNYNKSGIFNNSRSNSHEILKNLSLKKHMKQENLLSSQNKIEILRYDKESEDKINIIINPNGDEVININLNQKTNNTNNNEPNESSFYYNNQIKKIDKVSVFNKLKNLDNINHSHNTDNKNSKGNINMKNHNFNFKNNFLQSNINQINNNDIDKNSKINNIFENKNYKIKSSNDLPFILKSMEKNETLNYKQTNENTNSQNKKYFTENVNTNHGDSNLNIDSSLINKSLNFLNKKFEKNNKSLNLLKEKSVSQFKLDHNSTTSFLKQTLKEFSNNHNQINNDSSSVLSKQNIKSKEIYVKEFSTTHTNFNNELKNSRYGLQCFKENIGSNSPVKNNKGINFNKTGYTFFKPDKLDENKNQVNEYNNKFSKSVTKNMFNVNNKMKNKLDILILNTNNSESFDSNDDSYILAYNVFYTKINENKNFGNCLKKTNIIDINSQNDFKLKNTSAKDFLVRKKIIINRNKSKNLSMNKKNK